KRKSRYAMLALIIGSNLPDADIVTALHGGVDYLKNHRGITHSLLGLTVLAVILACILYAVGRKVSPRKNSPPLSLKWLFIVCWIATAVHVLMDFTNQYGVRPFLPFSGRWYAWDIMPIVGPYLLVILILGLGLPVLLRLVSQEIGASKRASKTGRTGAIVALCAMVALWGLRDFAHRRVLSMLDSHAYDQQNPRRVGAFPSPLSPFEWTGVVETSSAYYLLDANALAGDVEPSTAQMLRKPPPSPALTAAEHAAAAKVFLNFARFPWAMVNATQEGFEVYIRDLRYASPRSSEWGFVLEIDLDQSLRVQHASFSFRRAKPVY
ncbi:MAG TPA: metal-dependent hydrolase, partial [Terriglobia bacterium]|nr:metal-dependent hydrolase [Terriglobia bacterium]